VQQGGGSRVAGCEQVADDLGGACRSAQVRRGGGRVAHALLVRCLEDELLGGAVEVGGSLQCFGGGDAEVVQDVLDG